MTKVPLVNTSTSIGTVRSVFEGLGVKANIMPFLLALVSVENKRDLSAVYNNNLGNITTNTQDYFQFPTDSARKFESFATLEDGARGLLQLLNRPTHKRMLVAAQAGDVEAFVRGMTTPHPKTRMMYCDTCKYAPTLATYKQLVREFGGVARAKNEGSSFLPVVLFGGFLFTAFKLAK